MISALYRIDNANSMNINDGLFELGGRYHRVVDCEPPQFLRYFSDIPAYKETP